MKQKVVAMLLGMTMVVSALAGCGNKETESSTESSQKSSETKSEVASEESSSEVVEEPIEMETITLYPASVDAESGPLRSFMYDLFAERGLELEVWPYSDDKTNAILASGDLPDVMYVSAENLDIMIDAGMVLNLEEYVDQIPHVAESEEIQTALNYIREFRSAGTGELYAMPTAVGMLPDDGTTERYNLRMFWSYYNEIGCPEFDNMWDLIPIMEEIIALHPTDRNGNKVYGVGSYYNPTFMNLIYGYSTYFGYYYGYLNNMIAANMVDEELEYLLEKDGIMYESLKWYNALYRKGLFDPDSINRERDAHQTSMGDSGTYIVSMTDSPGWDPAYLQVWFEEQKVYYDMVDPYGSNMYLVVNADTEKLDAVLRLFDLLADPDAYMVWRSGPKGEMWDTKEGTNEVHLTEKWLESYSNKEEFVYSNGDKYYFWNSLPIVHVGTNTSYVDEKGNPVCTQVYNWSEYLNLLASTNDNMVTWRENYGDTTWIDLLREKGALTTNCKYTDIDGFMELPSDEQTLMINTLVDTIITEQWAMVFAETDEEFDRIWDQMVLDAEELGAKEIYDWSVQNIENAAAKKAALSK